MKKRAVREVSVAEAKNRLPALIHDAQAGRRVRITRRGRPVAVLLSAEEFERLARPGKDFFGALMEFRRSHDLEGLAGALGGDREQSVAREFEW